MSKYVVQISEADSGHVVTSWPPRSKRIHGTGEQRGDFIDALCVRVESKGVGLSTTTAHVLNDLREAWHELLHELKTHV